MRFFFRKCYIIGILCSHSLGVGNRVSKSDRPFGGKKEEEGSLLKMLVVANRCSNPSALSRFPTLGFFTKNSVCAEISWRGDVRYIYVFPSEWGGSLFSYLQRRGGGRGFDRLIGNSKGVRPNPQNPPSYAPAKRISKTESIKEHR